MKEKPSFSQYDGKIKKTVFVCIIQRLIGPIVLYENNVFKVMQQFIFPQIKNLCFHGYFLSNKRKCP